MEHHAEALIDEIIQAFRAETPSASGQKGEITPQESFEIIEEIYLFEDDQKKLYVPGMLLATIKCRGFDEQTKLIFRLVEFFDADFYDHSGNNDFFKKAKIRIFSSFTEVESKAIFHWLRYVEKQFGGVSSIKDLLSSAILYWGKRGNLLFELEED
jgi:hypothetical protein